jgi:chemotaxis protein histidine kinase CheA
VAEGEQRSGQLDRLVGEVAALRKALPPSPSREITSRQSAAIDGALARIAAMEAAVGELGAAAKSSTGGGIEARLGAVEAWAAAEAERAAARAKEAMAAEEAAARREGSREKSRVAEMQASLDAAARAAAAAEAAASTAAAAAAQAAAAQAHAEAQLLSLERRVAEEVALRASPVDPLAKAQLSQLTQRLGTAEETLAQLASAAAAAAVDAAATAARAAKVGEQDDPWRRTTLAELREVSDKQRHAEARLLELGLLVSRCDALEARGVAAEARHTALGGALEVLDGAKADRHETAAALQARPEIARDHRLLNISPLSPHYLPSVSVPSPYHPATSSLPAPYCISLPLLCLYHIAADQARAPRVDCGAREGQGEGKAAPVAQPRRARAAARHVPTAGRVSLGNGGRERRTRHPGLEAGYRRLWVAGRRRPNIPWLADPQRHLGEADGCRRRRRPCGGRAGGRQRQPRAPGGHQPGD